MTASPTADQTPMAHALPIADITDQSQMTARATATVFRALSHPLRLHMLAILAARGAASRAQLVAETGAVRSLVCRHLRSLEADGLVVESGSSYRLRAHLADDLTALVRVTRGR